MGCTKLICNFQVAECLWLQGFWDAVTLLSQHRRDDTPVVGAPTRTKSVAPTLAWLHDQKLAATEKAEGQKLK